MGVATLHGDREVNARRRAGERPVSALRSLVVAAENEEDRQCVDLECDDRQDSKCDRDPHRLQHHGAETRRVNFRGIGASVNVR